MSDAMVLWTRCKPTAVFVVEIDGVRNERQLPLSEHQLEMYWPVFRAGFPERVLFTRDEHMNADGLFVYSGK
jgi:hypothetical protein